MVSLGDIKKFFRGTILLDEALSKYTWLERTCSPLPRDAPVNSPFRRWPDFLRKGDTAAELRSRNVRVFKCGDFTFAINDKQQSGFFWY